MRINDPSKQPAHVSECSLQLGLTKRRPRLLVGKLTCQQGRTYVVIGRWSDRSSRYTHHWRPTFRAASPHHVGREMIPTRGRLGLEALTGAKHIEMSQALHISLSGTHRLSTAPVPNRPSHSICICRTQHSRATKAMNLLHEPINHENDMCQSTRIGMTENREINTILICPDIVGNVI
jgi:hypothetical protein